ncbi:hypothetical protein GIB67_007964 [Kingdonia uniflora]|uniref:Uncharacterized protein n=1 Tax=Kingdonia uniflora TaxID=39325 RepID=A0A7J7LTG2_9MAGN|nr:hypothetical protein GIB67_007964 [Kingdonia uniflora]
MEGQDCSRYCTMEFEGKIVGVKVNVINTTGPGDAFVNGDLQKMGFEGTRDFDLQRLTWLLFERVSTSTSRFIKKLRVEKDIEDFFSLYAFNVVFGVATAIKQIIQTTPSSKGDHFCMAEHLDEFMEYTEINLQVYM